MKIMKRAAVLILMVLAVMGSICGAVPIEPRQVDASLIGFKNAIIVQPSDNLQAKYNWLKSSSRDGQMGALSSTNRRELIGIGKFVGINLVADTNFVDFVSLTGNPSSFWVTGSSGSTIKQTANDVRFSNMTIETTGTSDGQTGGDIGLDVNTPDNSSSIYQNLHLKGTAVSVRYGLPVFGNENLGGTWMNCHATGWAWRLAANKEISGNFFNCISWYESIGIFDSTYGYGKQSFGGDTAGADCSGYFSYCITGDGGFGGCGTWGCNCSGTFIFCWAGTNSFALQRQFTGMAISCVAGFGSFGAGSSYDGVNAKMSGVLQDCIISGKGSGGMDRFYSTVFVSLGMGGDSSEGIAEGAIIRNCQFGYTSEWARGYSRAASNNVVGSGTQASLQTTFTGGDNSNITITSKKEGKDYNNYSFVLNSMVPPVWTAVLSGNTISVAKGTGLTKTASDLKTLLDSKSDITDLFTVGQVGDGSGNIDNSHATTYLSGGTSRAIIEGCCPPVPIICDSNTLVYYFDNGASYSNEGVGAVALTYQLPSAVVGYRYIFIDADNTAGADIIIDPCSTGDYIRLNDGTIMDGGESLQNTSDAYGEVTLKCRDPNHWTVYDPIGTWTEENP